MRKYKSLILFLCIVTSSTSIGKVFYKNKIKLSLTHDTPYSLTKLGNANGFVYYSSDDSFCSLGINNKKYQCTVEKVMERLKRRQYFLNKRRIYLNRSILKQILGDLGIDLNETELSLYDKYYGFTIFDMEKNKRTFQFHTDNNEESFHLTIKSKRKRQSK